MFKKIILLCLLTLSFSTIAAPLWHCNAVNKQGATWNDYASTRTGARALVKKQCDLYNDHKNCQVTCFPPRTYYRCVAHDTRPAGEKAGAWYWTSYSQVIAEHGAKDACRHNSSYGGCFVSENECAVS